MIRYLRPLRLGLSGVSLGVLLLGGVAAFGAESEPRTISGRITYVSPAAIEVAGVRGLLGPRSSLRSQGRAVTLRSLRRGMEARLELDEAGRVLELQVTGIVE